MQLQLLQKAQLELDEALYEKILEKLEQLEYPYFKDIQDIIQSGLQSTNTRTIALYIRYLKHYDFDLDYKMYLKDEDVGIRYAALEYILYKNLKIENRVIMMETSLYSQKLVAQLIYRDSIDIFNTIKGKEYLFLSFLELIDNSEFWDHKLYFRYLCICCFHHDSIINRFGCDLLYKFSSNEGIVCFLKIKRQIFDVLQFTDSIECRLLCCTALFNCHVDNELKLELLSDFELNEKYLACQRLQDSDAIWVLKHLPIHPLKEIMPLLHHLSSEKQSEFVVLCLTNFGFDAVIHIKVNLLCKSAKSKAIQYSSFLLSGSNEDIGLGLSLFSKLEIPHEKLDYLLTFTTKDYLLNIRSACYSCIVYYFIANLNIVDPIEFSTIFKNGLKDDSEIRLKCAQGLAILAQNRGYYIEDAVAYKLIFKEDSCQVALYLSKAVKHIGSNLMELLSTFGDQEINQEYGLGTEIDEVEWLLSIEAVVHQDCY